MGREPGGSGLGAAGPGVGDVRRPVLPTLLLVSAAAAALILAPLWRGGYLLYRDAVSTPRSYPTDAALGVGELPPRAVPQDWFVAMTSHVVDGGVVVIGLLTLALVFAGVGYGRLAARAWPSVGRSGAAAAALVAIWNPYVAERLLQGHWGLLVGYAALGWLIVAVGDLVADGRSSRSGGSVATRPVARPPVLSSSVARWAAVAGLFAVAGITPSGSIVAGIAAAVVLVGCLVTTGRRGRSGRGRGSWRGRGSERGRRWPVAAGVAVLWLLSALPWLVGAIVGAGSGSTNTPEGVRAFALRSEPFLGPLGTALGLGGIWNADAVPASRTMGWAAVATGCLMVVVVVGSVTWWRRRGRGSGSVPVGAFAVLSGVVVVVVAVSATGFGHWVLTGVVGVVPGGGLLRDTQKFLALAMPFVAVSAAGAVLTIRCWVPAGFALMMVAALVIAPLPDLAWGVGGTVTTVRYPEDWRAVAAIVPADGGAVAVWPPGTLRRYPFADNPSLDPAARIFAAPVVESGELSVDGRTVDDPIPRAAAVDAALGAVDGMADLRRLGVGWVLVERASPGTGFDVPPAVRGTPPAFAGNDLRLYRVPGATDALRASPAARAAAWSAHLGWLAMSGAGLAAAVWSTVRRRRLRPLGRGGRPPVVE
ncbi:hypothetical protein GCM10009624_24860 [Gordonia sinesedis]